MEERKTVADLYLRVCRDSNWSIGAVSAATLTAKILRIHPLEVWLAMPSMSVMEDVASGTHPACQTK